MFPLIVSSKLYGIISLITGILLCLFIGTSFITKLIITFIAYIAIEYGLMILKFPTITQFIKQFIGMFHN